MTQTTIELRQDGEPSENTTQYESAEGSGQQDVCAFYLANVVASDLPEHVTLTVSDEAEIEGELQKSTTNYGVYETAGGAVSGLYVSHERLSEIVGEEVDEESVPESIGIALSPSDEESFEESATVDEEEVEALVAGAAGESESADEEESEEEVEISDEAAGLTDD